MSRPLPELRDRVAETCRRLAAGGLVHATSGNVSARDGTLVAITPTGAVLADLGPDDIAVVGTDGIQHDGPFAPTSELGLHLAIYAHAHDARAVVHTHSPVATALACVLDEVPCVHYEMVELGGSIPVSRYATFGTDDLADRVVEAMGEGCAALMGNHGAVVHAHDLGTAERRAGLLERMCATYWHAAQIGEPKLLDAATQQAFRDAVDARGYGELREA